MEEETGRVTLVGETTGRQDTLHSSRASSTARKYLAAVTCVHTPAEFWARLGEAKSLKDFEGYLATLNEWCSLQKISPTELPKPKSYIAIKLDGLCWRRAQVLKIINDKRLSVFCIDTGVTADISIDQVCAKQNPILTQQSSQAIKCCLADVTSIRPNDWSEEAIKRFKSLVKQYPVYVEFQAITQMGGHMCSDIMLFVSNPTVRKGIKSIGKILADEGLAKYVGDDNDDDDDNEKKLNNKHVSFETKPLSSNVNTNSVNDEVINSAVSHVTPQSSESSDDVVVEESSSDDERSLEENCKSVNSSSSNNMAVNVMADSIAESEQVIGPSHLVENKNSFNIISRTANYSSSSSSSDEDDAWDDSLLAPVKPKPTTGIMNKADMEKNMQKRKALHAKFNEFLSTPLPQPAASERHPFGSRGKRGNRRGAQGIGRYAGSGRGSHPTVMPGWSGDCGNQTRNNVQHKKPLLSLQQQLPQQQFPQQQLPQQQFPQQQLPQQQFPQQQFPQQQFSQQRFPQQQQQPFPQQQFPQRQFPQQQFPQRQFPQQPQQFFRPQFPSQQLSSSQQDQPWQHNHSPKLRQLLTNKSPIKSTPQITTTATITTNTSTSIKQLDEQGMKNEYEWQKWMIERSVKKALEGVTDETTSDFNGQLKKILSDSSATTLNKFPNSKGAVWVTLRTVCSYAVDKPAHCSKAITALREIHKTCTDEMVRLFPQALQSCSEQVLKETTPTNTQSWSFCDFVCSLHRTAANDDNTSLLLLVDTSLDQLLKFWTDYALNVNCSEVQCGGCVDLIVTVFTNIAAHMTIHNWTLLEKCCKMVRSLILSSIPIKARESLLDFYMIITRCSTEADNVTSSLSSLPVDKATNQTGVSESTILNSDKSNQSSVKPDQSSESSVKPDEASVKPDQSTGNLDQSPVKLDQSPVKPDQSTRPNQSSVELNQPSVKLDQSPVKPEQSLIQPDQFSVKPDQTIVQLSHVTTTTLDTPPNHPTVVMATQSHEQNVVSSMTNISNVIATHVNQSSPPIYVRTDPYCKVSAMLTALNLSHLLENFKAAIIQDNLLSCDPSGLKEAMKEAGIPSGAVLSIMHYLKPDTNDTRVQYPTHQASYFQYPMHYPAAAAYNVQPSVHAAYLQQQPHPLAATQFTSVASPSLSHQVCSVPVSQQVMGIPSPTHPLQQPVSLVTGWADGHKMTQVQLAPGHYD